MPFQNYRKNYKKNYGNLQKKKWASLMRDVPLTTVVIDPTATGGSYATMVLNAAETATPTPTILKVKYPKISVDFAFDATLLNNGFACIMYVPQGVVINSGLPVLHPEWIMAWRNVPNDVTSTHHEIMLSSSMSRNLQSGDSIVLLFSFYNAATGPTSLRISARHSCVLRNN